MHFIWVSMVLALKYVNEDTIFMSVTGDGTTVAMQAMRRSRCLKGKGGTFISQLFKTLIIYWSSPMNCTHDLLLCTQALSQLSLSCCSAEQVLGR